PYHFNWASGRWDYNPIPAPGPTLPDSTATPQRTPPPLTPMVRIVPKVLPPPPRVEEAVPAAVQIPAHTRRATTRPTTFRAPTADPLRRIDPSSGRWMRDPNTGRWMHILPSDAQ